MKIRSLFLLIVSMILINPAQSREVTLSAQLGTPVMKAQEVRTTFLKISLTGFELADQQRPSANIAIVLDRSGSMSGDKLDRAKEAAIMAIDFLSPTDIVSIITYDSRIEVIVPATRVSDKAVIKRKIRNINARGNTALFAGVAKAAEEIRKFASHENINRIILLSDGQANVGPSSPYELGQLGMSLGRETISVSTIGLGLGYNEDLMTQLSGYSDGNHAFAENASDLINIFQNEFGNALSVVAQEIDIHIICSPSIRPIRVLGRDAQINGQNIRTRLNQLYGSQERYIMVEVEVTGAEAGDIQEVATVDVSYLNLQSKQKEKLKNRVNVTFSASEQEVQSATVEAVVEKAIIQVANEVSKEAVKLRDEGKIGAAQDLLRSNASYLSSGASQLNSPELKKMEAEARDDAEELDSTTNWNLKRKSLKERQYKLENQQSY